MSSSLRQRLGNLEAKSLRLDLGDPSLLKLLESLAMEEKRISQMSVAQLEREIMRVEAERVDACDLVDSAVHEAAVLDLKAVLTVKRARV